MSRVDHLEELCENIEKDLAAIRSSLQQIRDMLGEGITVYPEAIE